MEQKSEILKTAGELFTKCGLRSVSIDDICTQIHISKKTFYTYFPTKEDLIKDLLAVIRKHKEEIAEANCRTENAIDHALREINILRTDKSKKAFNFYYDLRKYYPKIAEQHEAAERETMFKYLCIGIRNGIEQGYFREDLNVEAMVIMMSARTIEIISDLKTYAKMSTAESTLFIVDNFMRLVTTPKGWDYYQQNKNRIK